MLSTLDRLARATPEQVKAAARKWLSRPAFSLTYTPGELDCIDPESLARL